MSPNLKTHFKDDLHDYLENPEDTKTFVKLGGGKNFKKSRSNFEAR
jgi:hypothetical protein